MKPILSDEINGFANVSISNERTYDINYLHKLLVIAVKKYSTKELKFKGLNPTVILIHVNNVLSRRHDRKT
jgi:hypothetical protein